MDEKRKTQRSEQLFTEAKKYFPGGVNSPVRAFKSVELNPPFIKAAKGAYVWDEDENKYIDYVASWGPAILGHAHPECVSAVQKAAVQGLSFGAPTEAETRLARIITEIMPSMEMMRFVSSGTEACMAALRLARGYTKRAKVIKFSGCYHGHSDLLLAKAGSGVATFALPDSSGVPESVTQDTIVIPFNDVDGVSAAFQKWGSDIAAVILEPIAGNQGFIRSSPKFIKTLRDLTTKSGSLLIFDEVMTGFRVGLRGCQAIYGVTPDLTTLGKVVGGGLPLAVYGGKRSVMEQIAPLGPVYQAGTLSGNPLSVACGIKTLEILKEKCDFSLLATRTKQLVSGLKELAQGHSIPLQVDAEGGMFGFFFARDEITSFEQAKTCDQKMFIRFFQAMLSRGIYLAPSAFEAGFVSFSHTEEDIVTTLTAAEKSFEQLRNTK
ncbi:MAG: glutamate-1-semialdehyde 2,1-aminomutase [Oligoflexales bacterium]